MPEHIKKEPSIEVINKRSDVDKIISEIFQLLADEDKITANVFHNLANELNMKIGITIRKSLNETKINYDILYSAKKPVVRSIFLIKIGMMNNIEEPTVEIKANLFNLDAYRRITEMCPDSIKNVIKNTGSCTQCYLHCHILEKVYTLDGELYNPCHKKGHNFKNLTAYEWKLLRSLVIEEHKYYTTI